MPQLIVFVSLNRVAPNNKLCVLVILLHNIFNRCEEGTEAASYKRNIRAVNPRAQVAFEKEDGEPFVFEEEMPFDVEADVIEIE